MRDVSIIRFFTVLFMLTLVGIGLAQPENVNWNIGEWGKDVGALAGGVAGIVWLIRRFIWKRLDGPIVKAVAVLVGTLVGAGLGLSPGAYDGVVDGAWHGLLAGVGSFLGVDAIRDIVNGQGTSEKKKVRRVPPVAPQERGIRRG